MSTTIESLEGDHWLIWFTVLGLAVLISSTFLVTREQIRGLPQREPAIVRELRCPYGEAVDILHADDGSSSATCEADR